TAALNTNDGNHDVLFPWCITGGDDHLQVLVIESIVMFISSYELNNSCSSVSGHGERA
uniref:Uncharacterized protein n=1 Tax=Oryza brachyantha TaxID=4533 RepID=J3KV20_ORYBR